MILFILCSCVLAGCLSALYGQMRAPGGRDPLEQPESRPDVEAARALALEGEPEGQDDSFTAAAHALGVSTGHWLPGHEESCQECLAARRAKEIGEAEAKRELLARTRHFPIPGRQFDYEDEEIVEKSFAGDIIMARSYRQIIHDPDICQTCLDAGVRGTMPREFVPSSLLDNPAGVVLRPRSL